MLPSNSAMNSEMANPGKDLQQQRQPEDIANLTDAKIMDLATTCVAVCRSPPRFDGAKEENQGHALIWLRLLSPACRPRPDDAV